MQYQLAIGSVVTEAQSLVCCITNHKVISIFLSSIKHSFSACANRMEQSGSELRLECKFLNTSAYTALLDLCVCFFSLDFFFHF